MESFIVSEDFKKICKVTEHNRNTEILAPYYIYTVYEQRWYRRILRSDGEAIKLFDNDLITKLNLLKAIYI